MCSINTVILFFAEEGAGWQEHLPGLETWVKVLNLLLFAGLLFFILRRPISEAFSARRDSIRRDLIRAQEERNAALAKLEEVEGRLALLNTEVESIRAQAQREAEEESARIERTAEEDARKLREQATREIESAAKTAKAELRTYAAEQSVKLAEEMIKREMRAEDDRRLMSEYVEELGGINR
ncbi:MAG TPA: ATP synthase F0 subunit B [Pyrinomonadaceae bacterium]|nr:ATP synthase F0 subunit B [Pyrinomonadaceae bacterium]